MNEWIRRGKMTREEAVPIVQKFDGACSDRYITSFCEFISITENQFWEIVNAHVNQDLFEIQSRARPRRKFTIGANFS